MKAIIAIFLILATLCSVGLISYRGDIFQVADDSLLILSDVTSFFSSVFQRFVSILNFVFDPATNCDVFWCIENNVKKVIITSARFGYFGWGEYDILYCNYLVDYSYWKPHLFFGVQIYGSNGLMIDSFTRDPAHGFDHFESFETAYSWCIDWLSE